jgi:hypothetical protein
MASLTGNLISSTYQSVLKITTNNTASAALNNVTDGVGNATGLFVSTTGTAISGSFTVTGSMIVSGTLTATSSNATSASYALTSSFAITAQTASYILNAVSSSFAITAQTASYILNAVSSSFAASANNANLLDGLDSTVFATTSSNTFTGTQVVSGSLRLFESASFTLPTSQPATAVAGTAFFSGSFLYIYNGTAYKSASFN